MAAESIDYDVAVVGSGPGGACAAQVIAAAGLRVVILEREFIPRYKTCGGGILGRAMRFLGEAALPVVERACHTAEFVLTEKLRFAATRPEAIVLMTMRDRFDEWLTRKALDAGAHLRTDCTVQDVVIEKDHVRLATSLSDVRAQFVIAADGANGVVARKAGWPDYRCVAPALECEVSVSSQEFDRLSVSARFDFEPVPCGYAWVFPKKAHLSIGVLTLNPKGVNLNHCFKKYLDYLGIHNPASIERHGFIIPVAPRHRVLARDSILLVGDAAGLADPVTAEGISHAIRSGQLAGEAIVSAFPHREQVAANYNATMERSILAELRWARRLAGLLYGMPRTRNVIFKWQGQRLTETMANLVSGQTSYREVMTSPSNYLKFLTRC